MRTRGLRQYTLATSGSCSGDLRCQGDVWLHQLEKGVPCFSVKPFWAVKVMNYTFCPQSFNIHQIERLLSSLKFIHWSIAKVRGKKIKEHTGLVRQSRAQVLPGKYRSEVSTVQGLHVISLTQYAIVFESIHPNA